MRSVAICLSALVVLGVSAARASAEECRIRPNCDEECRNCCRMELAKPVSIEEDRPAQALSDAERAALEKLASEHPELADQKAGYLTNEDLITILLVILIIVILI